MLVRLSRTIRYVVSNPYRSVFWKIADSLVLAFFCALVLICLIGGSLYFLFLLPVVWLITRRSWYELPGSSRRRPKPAINRGSETDNIPPGKWDPVARKQL